MNREPSPDRLAFQIAGTTISSNYPGEELETLDREVLVVSTDIPSQDGETNEQRQERVNANAERAIRRQQELAAVAPAVGQQPVNPWQLNDNVEQQAPVEPTTPQLCQQGNEPRANRLRARDLLRDSERDGHEVYNSRQSNLGAALAALNHLEDSTAVRRLQANVHVAAAQIEERGPGYSRSAATSYSRRRLEHPRQRRRSNGPLEPVVEEGRGENKVMLPVNPAANAAANALANSAANALANPTADAPANAPANTAAMPPATSPTILMLPTSRETPLQTQGKMHEPNLRRCKLIVSKVVSVNA
jgi:hypothetical protein